MSLCISVCVCVLLLVSPCAGLSGYHLWVFSFVSWCVYCMHVCVYLCICVFICICSCCLCVHGCLCKALHVHASASTCYVHACLHVYLCVYVSLCVSNVSVCLCCIADTQGGDRKRVGSRVPVIPQILASLLSSGGRSARPLTSS